MHADLAGGAGGAAGYATTGTDRTGGAVSSSTGTRPG